MMDSTMVPTLPLCSWVSLISDFWLYGSFICSFRPTTLPELVTTFPEFVTFPVTILLMTGFMKEFCSIEGWILEGLGEVCAGDWGRA